jgi:signal transduction histidine kinase
MNPDVIQARYESLERYVQWTPDDAARVIAAAPLLQPHLTALIDDFYEEVERHIPTRAVITGGPAQIARLKGTLRTWIEELLQGPHDLAYAQRRYRVGWRHVEINLPAAFTNVAMSRIRTQLTNQLFHAWTGSLDQLRETTVSLQKRLDLDLAIIEEAYQVEHSQRLQSAERLITLGQVAGGIAHELRNPLSVIQTSAFYLKSARNLTPDKRTEHLDRIERNVDLANNVITALSNFARMPVPNLVPLDLATIVRSAIDAESLPKTILLQIDIPATLPQIRSDAGQLRIVIGNLIRNARDAMPAGGSLTLRASADDDQAHLEVIDTGVGIPPEQLSRVMDPLFSTKARGLGLGLSIARSIIEKVQGRLQVASQLGTGTTFTISLPIVPPPPEAGCETAPASPHSSPP